MVVVLSTELTPELIAEGLARDFVRIVQDRRKDLGLEFTDRIEIGLIGTSPELQRALEQFRDYICGETLAVKMSFDPVSGAEPVEVEIGEAKVTLYVKRQ